MRCWASAVSSTANFTACMVSFVMSGACNNVSTLAKHRRYLFSDYNNSMPRWSGGVANARGATFECIRPSVVGRPRGFKLSLIARYRKWVKRPSKKTSKVLLATARSRLSSPTWFVTGADGAARRAALIKLDDAKVQTVL